MVEEGPVNGFTEKMREEAAAWLARINGPDGEACRREFEAWFNADPGHAAAFEAVLESWEQSEPLVARTPAVQKRAKAKARKKGFRMPLGIAAALGAGLLALAGLSIHHVIGSMSKRNDDRELISRLGEIRTLTLDDGSKMTLDTASMAKVAFTDGERRVVLEKGRARFEVAHDAARLFVVQAGDRLVVAHGTIFDVALGARAIAVTLLRGSVEVKRTADRGAPAHTGQMLIPGQSLALPVGKAQAVPPVEPKPFPARSGEDSWPSGMLGFDSRPLSEVIAMANRYNEHHLVLAEPKLGELLFTGTVAARDAAGLADMLSGSLHLAVSGDRQGNFILSRSPQKKH